MIYSKIKKKFRVYRLTVNLSRSNHKDQTFNLWLGSSSESLRIWVITMWYQSQDCNSTLGLFICLYAYLFIYYGLEFDDLFVVVFVDGSNMWYHNDYDSYGYMKIVIDIKIVRLLDYFMWICFCSPWSVIGLGLIIYLKMVGKTNQNKERWNGFS